MYDKGSDGHTLSTLTYLWYTLIKTTTTTQMTTTTPPQTHFKSLFIYLIGIEPSTIMKGVDENVAHIDRALM